MIAITVVSSYSVVTVNVVNNYKEDYKARSLYLSPLIKPITDEALKAISSVEHVEFVADITGLPWYSVFSLTETSDAQIDEQIRSRETRVEICCLYEGEVKEVVNVDLSGE